jgi:hypothetical protein
MYGLGSVQSPPQESSSLESIFSLIQVIAHHVQQSLDPMKIQPKMMH